jgi:hypothetical protein
MTQSVQYDSNGVVESFRHPNRLHPDVVSPVLPLRESVPFNVPVGHSEYNQERP